MSTSVTESNNKMQIWPISGDIGDLKRSILAMVLFCAAFFGTWEFLEEQLTHHELPPGLTASHIARGLIASLVLAFWSGYLAKKILDKERRKHQVLEQAISRAEKSASLGFFAGEVAHEVGNPLAALSSLVQSLKEDETQEDKKRKLGLILSQVDRLQGLVSRIKASADGVRKKEAVKVKDLVGETLSLYKYDHEVDGKITLETGDLEGTVQGEWEGLVQIILNLVKNGCQAMAETGGILTIESETKGTSCLVRVRDSGPGLSGDMMDSLFSPFVTDKPQGSGIGLFVSRRVAESMGGSLEARNLGQGGAEFILTLKSAEPAGINQGGL